MSTTGSAPIPPPMSWAQRHDLLYVIIDVECNDIEYKVTDTSFYFKGVNALDSDKKYEVTLTFLHPVLPDRVTSKNIGRCMEFTIYKREAGPFWPSLSCLKTKLHFLKANFTKWANESDDESDAANDPSTFGPIMDDVDWKNKFDDFNVDNYDSDDNIPSLSQNDDEDSDDEQKGGGDKKKDTAAAAVTDDKDGKQK